MQDSLNKIDDLIKQGQAIKARKVIQEICREKIDRRHLLTVATLARRLDLPSLGIRILNPIVRPSAKNIGGATDPEKIEYAYCLFNYGARQEALSLLHSVSTTDHPEALLLESFVLTSNWNFRDMIPLMKQYTASKNIDDYQRIVGNVNLVMAYVYEEESEKAEQMLNALMQETKEKKLELANGKLLSLYGQNLITQKRWDEAITYFNQAKGKLAESDGVESLLIDKWQAVMSLMREGAKALPQLRAVRESALKANRAETVRHCDFLEASVLRDEKLALYIYFGTPYPCFRERLVSEFRGSLKLPESYKWRINVNENSGASVVEALVKETNGKDNRLKTGLTLHRSLTALASDFYRPLTLTAIHYALYPGDNFNPVSSPDRVHQILKKLRAELKKRNIPIEVIEEDKKYHLTSPTGAILIVPQASATTDRKAHFLIELQKRWSDTPFSAKEAGEHLGINFSTARKVLKKARTEGQVDTFGEARSTRYFFKATDKKIAA